MTTFLQFHILTAYPPSNLNRDDLGRPKTAIFGGKQRIRISSQALKRAWRTSAMFGDLAKSNMGERTKRIGREAYEEMIEAGIDGELAKSFAIAIAGTFAKTKKKSKEKKDEDGHVIEDLSHLETEQLVHISPVERQAISTLISEHLVSEDDFDKKAWKTWSKQLLHSESKAADIAMFGRMLADNPGFNVEAAVQVSHAITVHEVEVEDDYFSAVDDLNKDDAGAGHIGEASFASGLFYVYLNVNVDDLITNLSGDTELAIQTLTSLARACACVSPSGKQNSFAAQCFAHYMLVEKGSQTPRQLSAAFLQGGPELSQIEQSIQELEQTRDRFDAMYGKWADDEICVNLMAGKEERKSLDDVTRFIQEMVHAR